MSEVPKKFGQLEGDTVDEAVAKGIDRLSTLDKIKLMSHLNRREVEPICLAFSVGEELDYGWLVAFANNKLGVLVSVKGRGRQSVENVAKGQAEKTGMRGALDRVGGFITGK